MQPGTRNYPNDKYTVIFRQGPSTVTPVQRDQ
jgi:hypothetical protein